MTEITVAKVKRAYATLGTTAKQVAKSLEQQNIKGVWACAFTCPVANFLRKKLKTRRKITVTRKYTNVGKRKEIQFSTPKPIAKFIEAFDAKKYPKLLDEREPCSKVK